MAEIGASQITVASGSCTEASNNSNTRQCTKRKKWRKKRGKRRKDGEKEEQGQGGHKKAEENRILPDGKLGVACFLHERVD